MSVKSVVAGCVAALVLVGAAGCSTPSGGVAAEVDGHVITQAQVQRSAQGTMDVLTKDPQYAKFDGVAFALQNYIVGQMLSEGLSGLGVTITDEQRDQYWSQIFDPAGAEYTLWSNPGARECLNGYVDLAIVNSMIKAGDIDADRLLSLVNALPITVSPRYGTWDVEAWNVTSRVSKTASGVLADPITLTTR